jgi:hypothetical protein
MYCAIMGVMRDFALSAMGENYHSLKRMPVFWQISPQKTGQSHDIWGSISTAFSPQNMKCYNIFKYI